MAASIEQSISTTQPESPTPTSTPNTHVSDHISSVSSTSVPQETLELVLIHLEPHSPFMVPKAHRFHASGNAKFNSFSVQDALNELTSASKVTDALPVPKGEIRSTLLEVLELLCRLGYIRNCVA